MKYWLAGAALAVAAACAPKAETPLLEATAKQAEIETLEAAHKAHEAYVDAINSNDPSAIVAVLTEDIVYQSPHAPAVVGKAAVSKWLEEYLSAYTTRWVKTSTDFHVAGDWAFELYDYKSVDAPKDGGAPIEDVGKGINIYHHDADGVWRVARDGWSTDLPIPAK